MKRVIRRLLCRIGVHLHGVWGEDGITCEDCGYFRSKWQVMADWHAGWGL